MHFLRTNGRTIYAGERELLLRGMGLGGWLLPEGYIWKFYTKCDRPRRMETLIEDLCGKDYARSFWPRYFDAFITERDIAWLAAQGLNSVRLALNSRHLFQVDAAGQACFDEEGLQYVDRCLAWCERYGLYLFLDMHGAPGGQTGTNIDDCENDRPELFNKAENQELLVQMWTLLARRYRDVPAIGGYDLLNEPITKWNSHLYPQLIPLYRRLIAAIRAVDEKHIIILEGVHWATDFSVFDALTPEEADNIVLEFHKYWSDPDEESLKPFLAAAERLNVSLWMGEGGENNLEWYTYVFPMYERLGIGWCFWTYKKMDTPNSPVTFAKPAQWDAILAFLDGGARPDEKSARAAFDGFLSTLSNGTYHPEVLDAALRRPPLDIPAAAFDTAQIISRRSSGAAFRMDSPATILFADGHAGAVDWKRYGGEPQPETERLVLRLWAGDAVGYRLSPGAVIELFAQVRFCGEGTLCMQGQPVRPQTVCRLPAPSDSLLWLQCTAGCVDIESLSVWQEDTL